MNKHSRPYHKLLLGGLLMILTSLFTPLMAAAQDQGPTDSAEITAFFEGLMQSYLKANHIPGATVAIVKEGDIIFSKGYGYANVETRAPVDPATTLFRVGSVSKLFTWMAVMQFPLSLVGSDPTVFLHFEARHILPAVGVGLAGLSSHYCLSNAFRSGDATLVVPLDFMRIPLIAVVGWAFYGEPLDVFVLLGALIIISGVFWNLRSEVASAH